MKAKEDFKNAGGVWLSLYCFDASTSKLGQPAAQLHEED